MTIALTHIKYENITKIITLLNVFFFPILENSQWDYKIFITQDNNTVFHLRLDKGVATKELIQSFLDELTQTLNS